jgi:hypothetical protein
MKLKRRYQTDDRPGWVIGACITCESCTRGKPKSENWDASRLREESDCPEHCDNCGVLLTDGGLTGYGQEYVREAVRNYTGDPKILAMWLEHFKYAFDGEPEEYGGTIRALNACSEKVQAAFPGLANIPGCYAVWDKNYGLLIAGNNLAALTAIYHSVTDDDIKVVTEKTTIVMLPWDERLKL